MDVRHGVPESEPVPTVGPARWRVPPRLVALKLVGVAAFALVAGLVWDDPRRAAVAGVAALGLAVYALRDLVAPVRLAADAAGVTVVVGFARRLRLPWSRIEGVRVDARSRYGVSSSYLEIDAGDSVHVLTANDLGAPPDEVARVLSTLTRS